MTINRTILAALVALGTGGPAAAGMLQPIDAGFGPGIGDGRALDLNLAAFNERLSRGEPAFGRVALEAGGTGLDRAGTVAVPAPALRPIEARGVALGSVTGVAYYTIEGDDLRVVTTLAEGETGLPVRLEATLAVAGESVVLSTPGADAAGSRVEITRVGDAIEIRDGALAD